MTDRLPNGQRGIRRVGIIGMGSVGSAFAYSLVHEGRISELVLVDRDIARAEGEMMDLSHCMPYGRPVKLEVGDLDSIWDCELIVVAAGHNQRPGESRLDLLKRNADIFTDLFPYLSSQNPDTIFIIITNPVDVMTRFALSLANIPPEQMIGTGTWLDTARFRLLLGQHLGVDSRSVQAYVIGEHGDSEVLVWSRVTVGPYKLEEYAEAVGRPITSDVRREITRRVKTAANEIIERKEATNFAIGVSTLRIYEAIRYNQASLMTVSRELEGAYGLRDVCLSIPCLLKRFGADVPMELDLAENERAALLESAQTLDQAYRDLAR